MYLSVNKHRTKQPTLISYSILTVFKVGTLRLNEWLPTTNPIIVFQYHANPVCILLDIGMIIFNVSSYINPTAKYYLINSIGSLKFRVKHSKEILEPPKPSRACQPIRAIQGRERGLWQLFCWGSQLLLPPLPRLGTSSIVNNLIQLEN